MGFGGGKPSSPSLDLQKVKIEKKGVHQKLKVIKKNTIPKL
jgi:hypothetical protein